MPIRPLTPADYPAVYALWRACELSLSISDERPEVEKMLKANPTTCLVCEDESGRIIGAVLGGYDGRRGLIHHLAVDPGSRKRGIGRELMQEVERRFRELGVVKVNFWVEIDRDTAPGVIEFYERLGYTQRPGLGTMSKVLREK
jgi:ribosomal protein S18 acetylase RimI-like enzyme